MGRAIVLGHVQVLVSLPVMAGLAVLLGAVWLLRGGRAVLGTCLAVGVTELVLGLAAGNVVQASAGVVIIALAGWSLWPWHTGRGRP